MEKKLLENINLLCFSNFANFDVHLYRSPDTNVYSIPKNCYISSAILKPGVFHNDK